MLQPGQKVYVKKIGNAARNRKPEDLVTEEIVEKVGKKYFYLKDYYREKFSIEEMRDISEYSSNCAVYESKKEIEEEDEYFTKVGAIRAVFMRYGSYPLSLEAVRRIYSIIEEDMKL